jgi:hypothetical protein
LPPQIEVHHLKVMLWNLRRRPDDIQHAYAICDMWRALSHCHRHCLCRYLGHRETWPVRSKRFRGWLRRRYYEATGGALNGQAISSEVDLLEARAQFDAPERSVHIRIAEHDGHVYFDLADEHWRAIEIGPDGWRVNRYPPVRFRRPAGMLPLPVPEQGGSIEALLSLLNLSSPNDFVLVVAWLWRRCDPAAPIHCWRYPGSKARPRPSCRKC